MESSGTAIPEFPVKLSEDPEIMDKVYKEYLRKSGKLSRMNTMDLIEQLDIQVDQNDHYTSNGAIRNNQELSIEEKQFLLAAERGDLGRIRSVLEASQLYLTALNINCVDPLGRSALLISIENENIELMELLLAFDVEVGDALLHAINEENVEAVELLLNHQSNKKKDIMSYFGATVSDSFTPDITPIILAAHRDNYEIIKVLLDRGDRIPKPHDVQCSCKDCVLTSSEDILRHSRSRINAYRALASPSLIALSSKDPVLTAFELSWELKRLSNIENEFRSEYQKLAMQCQNFAVDLLDQTRGSKELEVILNHDTMGPVSEGGESRMTLSRLKLAIKYKQKNFVAHPNCQQLLASLWYEGLPGFRRWNIGIKVFVIFAFGLMFPIWSLLYIVAPKSRLSSLLRKPFMKFISHAAAYFTFLFLLILTSQRLESLLELQPRNSSTTIKTEKRGAPPTIIEWLVIAWVAGLIWAEIKQLWHEGVVEYIHDMWNLLDFTTNALYVATIGLRVVAYYRVNYLEKGEFRHVPRSEWDAYDPNLIAEALFAAANIFSTLKLVYIFTINPQMGPLQISLGRMVVDIFKWFVVFALTLFSFACGLNQLYYYYQSVRNTQCEKDPSDSQCENDSFSNLFQIMQTLYWAIFGLVELQKTNLSVRDHKFTELIGKLMFGTYSYVAIIVLLNMLIAMMNNSYQLIFDKADTEWKFARSRLWMSYFDEGCTVPAPFNIIPTPKSIWHLLCWLKDLFCRCTPRHKKSRWQSIRKIVKKVHEREQRYQAVMRNLVKRYIMHKGRGNDDEGVTVDDISEIKQDVSAFRFELLEILKNNGMKIPHYSAAKSSGKKFGRRKSGMTLERLNKRTTSVETIPETDEKEDIAKINLHVSSSDGELSVRSRKIYSRDSPSTRIKSKKSPLTENKNGKTPNGRIPDEGLGDSLDQQTEQQEKSAPAQKPAGHKEVTLDPAALTNIDVEAGVAGDAKGVVTTAKGVANSPFTHKPAKRVTFSWQNCKEDEDKSKEGDKEPYIYNGKL